jgi:negative regulator of sigma E activity
MNHNVQDTENTRDAQWGERLSAYLDGELTPAEARALKEQIAVQPHLRQELEEMRMTREVMRSVPLQTPPRNYLLTPSMVAAEQPSKAPAPRSRRMPLLLLRLATSLTAIAFVITVGVGYVQNTARPAAQLTRKMSQPEVTSVERTSDIEQMEMEAEDETFAESQAATSAPAGTLSPQEEMALSEVPEKGQEGMGGGAGAAPMPEEPAEEAAPLAAQQQETEEADVEQADTEDAADTNGDIAVASEDAGEEAAAGKEAGATQEDELLPISPDEPEVAAPEIPEDRGQRAAFPPQGLSAVLGVLTLILAALTFWFSRRS